MQVILNIDDELLLDMQQHADIVQEDLNVMLSNMFIKFVGEPRKVIKEEVRKDNCKEFEDFQMFLHNFLTTTACSDIIMRKVILRIREHSQDMHIMTDLYKTYKNTL